MVDKPAKPSATAPLIGSHAQSTIVTAAHWQIKALRLIGKEPTSITLGKSEYRTVAPYFTLDGVTRMFGLEVKIDGDVGVRVG